MVIIFIMGKKVSPFEDGNGCKGYHFHCEGCDSAHVVYVTGNDVPNWSFNGNEEKPTFKPSILARWTEGIEEKKMVCHSFVTDGRIKYLNDCTHNLKGKTVELLDF